MAQRTAGFVLYSTAISTLLFGCNAFAQQLDQHAPTTVRLAQTPPPTPPVNACSPSQTKFVGRTTPAFPQGNCNGCWAFATATVFEESYFRRGGGSISVSAKQILDCTDSNHTCLGGPLAFDFLSAPGKGTVLASDYAPYNGVKESCNVTPKLRAVVWSAVGADPENPTIDEIKRAICTHGAVGAHMNRSGSFDTYKPTSAADEVFTDNATGSLAHVVAIVGWDHDRSAWRIKNSMGADWGLSGYMWITYGSNKIGSHAAWVDAEVPVRPQPPTNVTVR